MTGFLEALVRRGAGLEPPSGQQLLKLRPLSRFESTWTVTFDHESADRTNTEGEPGDSTRVPDNTLSRAEFLKDHRHDGPGDDGLRLRLTPSDASSVRTHEIKSQSMDQEQATNRESRSEASPAQPNKTSRPEDAKVDRGRTLPNDELQAETRATPGAQAVPAFGSHQADSRVADHVSAMSNARQTASHHFPHAEERAPHFTISIGRIEIDFERQTDVSVSPKRGPERTRGFTDYARARHGILR
jgi:hypothetical protein